MTRREFEEFMSSPRRNCWVYGSDMNVYVRKAAHYCPAVSRALRTFDVGSISVHRPGTGVFTRWYPQLRAWADEQGFQAVFIESVQNERFADSLRKRGLYEHPEIGFYDLLREYNSKSLNHLDDLH